MSQFFDQFTNYLLGKESPIATQVIADEKGDEKTRLAIYRDSYRYQLIDIIAKDFPTIYAILGTTTFIEVATLYLKRYPSTSYTVRHFGQHFAKFLHETPPYSDYPYLWQIADFEWAKGEIFDAPDSDILTFDDLPSIAPEDWAGVTFDFIPALKRLSYDYNVPQIWQEISDSNDEDDLPAPIELREVQPWIMWRKDFAPHWRTMNTDENAFLIGARQDLDFSMLCEKLAKYYEDEITTSTRAAEIVRQWIEDKIVATLIV